MANFWDRLLELKFDLHIEINKIETLLQNNVTSDYIFYDLIRINFLTWQFRRNFIEFDDFITSTDIKRIIEKASTQNITTDEYLDYIEYIINILPLSFRSEYNCRNESLYYFLLQNPEDLSHNEIEKTGIINNVLENIFNVLEQINYKIENINGVYRVIVKDAIVLNTAADLYETTPKISDDILLYGHRSNAGNLKEKSSILARLYIYHENEIEKEIIQEFSSLNKDIHFLANNLSGIRHGTKSKEAIALNQYSDAERETLMDELFTLFLCAIQLKNQKPIHIKISEIKKEI